MRPGHLAHGLRRHHVRQSFGGRLRQLLKLHGHDRHRGLGLRIGNGRQRHPRHLLVRHGQRLELLWRPGDLSSIWSGGECECQGGGAGNCTTAPSCPMEQDCGKCVAVKCNPNGTISEGGYNHDMYCGTTEYVVIEVIDAALTITRPT